MRYRKTPGKERDTYKLYDDFGELLCEIKAGDYGVTADDIKVFMLWMIMRYMFNPKKWYSHHLKRISTKTGVQDISKSTA